jgi:hypothetical protein
VIKETVLGVVAVMEDDDDDDDDEDDDDDDDDDDEADDEADDEKEFDPARVEITGRLLPERLPAAVIDIGVIERDCC